MKDYIKSFRRLFKSGYVEKTFFYEKLQESKISQEEYDYIIS